MAKIVRGGQSGSADHINSSQATFRAQISAITDAIRQMGGNAEIGSGAVTNDPLNAPYVLYVNPYTGTDTFVGGNYSTSGTATQRIELQRLECGYSEPRPFKTINRAIIEAGIITAKSFYESPLTNNDLVSIVLAPGVYTIYNSTGAASVSEWTTGKSPTTDELTEFNTNTTGGLMLPRGVSLCGLDLRKTIFRPHSVPSVADEAADASNRRAIFKVTGTGYYFGFTFMDKAGSTASHHLLHAFEFASQSELDEFYTKIQQAFGGTNNTGGLSNALAVTKTAEYEIVGPQPTSGSQTINTDTTLSASPYIFNCSIRSNYGLCGVYADGAKTSGFRSLVIAQFTGVSLQRDLNCWQQYDNGQDTKWSSTYFTNYADYISTPPNNVRMDPARRSFHIRAVNNAVIQEVSVFAIGQGIHHWTQTGGEITITNSNSNFGGCAAVSEGYRTVSAAADTNWNVSKIRVATNLTDKANNIQRIYLGTISAVTSNTITLTTALGDSTTVPGVPEIVAAKGYTLRSASRVWVENPLGPDWSSTFTGSAWSSGSPTVMNINTALQNEDSEAPAVISGISSAVGKRVYIRRLVDTRSPDERRFTLKLNNTAQGSRLPVRDYVVQTDIDGASISGAISGNNLLLVANSTKLPTAGQGVYACSEVVLRRGNPSVSWTSATAYKKGDTVKRNGKHYTCIKDNADTNFDASKWDESYVHMPSDYNPEDFYKNDVPVITFDNDTASTEDSTTLGYNLTTVWSSDSLISAQYRSGTDYRGLHLFLTALGFTSDQAHTILAPKAPASRERDPSSSSNMGGYTPSGAANALANWPIEFRRPSVIRLFGHAWEWAGYLNYTKAIPAYQGDLSPQNKFTSYFTNVNGGRVYATGFNEEGFQVTPRGLEDISTGTTLTVESLGASDLALAPVTELTGATLRGTTVVPSGATLSVESGATVNIQGNITLPASATASTAQAGVAEIASIAEIRGASYVSTDSQLNTSGARFVTPEGLEHWRSYNKILSQRTGSTTFYVAPDHAEQGGTYSFNGTNYTLTLDPGRSDLSGTLAPSTPAKAVKLSVAATYANQTLSKTETANYYLANGRYWTAVTFNHSANIYGAYNSFPYDNVLASGFTTGSAPTTNIKALYDNYSTPTFGAALLGYLTSGGYISYIIGSSAALTFNNGGSVNGISFIGMDRLIKESSYWPDSLFSGGASHRTTTGNVVAKFANLWYIANGGTSTFYHYYQTPRINLIEGALQVRNVISGPGLPGRGGRGSGQDSSLVDITKGTLQMCGVYLLGNTSVTKTELTGIVNMNITNVTGTQHLQSLVSGYVSDNNNVYVMFDYAYGSSSNSGVNYTRLDYDVNCIHILDNQGNYGTAASKQSSNLTLRGATFRTMIGALGPNTNLITGGYQSYARYCAENEYNGFAGTLGCAISYVSEPTTGTDYSPSGISWINLLDTTRELSYHYSLWQQARTGTYLTADLTTVTANALGPDTNTTNQTGGVYYAFTTGSVATNWMNINSYTWLRGVNVNSGARNNTTFYG